LQSLGLFDGRNGVPLHVGHEGAQILGGNTLDLPRQAVDLAVGVHEDVIAPVALGENEAVLLKGRLKRLPIIGDRLVSAEVLREADEDGWVYLLVRRSEVVSVKTSWLLYQETACSAVYMIDAPNGAVAGVFRRGPANGERSIE